MNAQLITETARLLVLVVVVLVHLVYFLVVFHQVALASIGKLRLAICSIKSVVVVVGDERGLVLAIASSH
jgi:hypothetical protein